MKRLAILGSTGTIGKQTLDLVDQFPSEFQVVVLAAGRNIVELKNQIEKYQPSSVCCIDRSAAMELKSLFPATTFFAGEEGLTECVTLPSVDIVVVGIVGFAALHPTLAAIRAKKQIALANKETLVVAGALVLEEIKKAGVTCIPVDSEHNALFQLLEKFPRKQVSTIVLTASGGPFRERMDLSDVTPEEAIQHPNWKMGPKISVDSATLMNKGLELIEAHFLFDFSPQEIEVWIHPQSIVHGAVWLKDNSCVAHLGKPSMKSPIAHALKYPDRVPAPIPKLSFKEFSKLEFAEPDEKRFPCLNLAKVALEQGPKHLVALNAGNEVAVDAFLRHQIQFMDIPKILEKLLSQTSSAKGILSLDEILEEDHLARQKARSLIGRD